jgi:2-iminobutanoate/2-iminopropanoate deaminase
MEKKIITSTNAPAPIGPYNQAVAFGNFLFVSGQIALHPQTGMMMNDNVIDETVQVMENIKAILYEAGMDFNNIIKSSIFILDMGQFSTINQVYGSYFEGIAPPARETIQVCALPKAATVEISVIAAK